jgi:AcrR family transcriptional regulator
MSEATTTTRPYHHGNLREELLDRAEQLVRERGVADLSLRELAREAGVSHAAPRRHFEDRQALLDALALRGFERLGAELAAAMRGGRGGFDRRVLRVATTYVRFATRDAALLELMFAGKRMEVDGPLHDAAETAFASILGLIAEGQAGGELSGDDPLRTGTVLFAALQGVASLSTGGMLADASLEDVVRDTVGSLLDGLRPR